MMLGFLNRQERNYDLSTWTGMKKYKEDKREEYKELPVRELELIVSCYDRMGPVARFFAPVAMGIEYDVAIDILKEKRQLDKES